MDTLGTFSAIGWLEDDIVILCLEALLSIKALQKRNKREFTSQEQILSFYKRCLLTDEANIFDRVVPLASVSITLKIWNISQNASISY